MRTEAGRPATVPRPDAERPLRCGVDLVSVSRVASLLAEFGDSFRTRAFTPAERAYCDGRGDPPQHYAARWAVKEAFVKAVSAEAQPVPFRAIGVDREGDGGTVEPTLALAPRARRAVEATMGEAATEETVTAVSLSHDRDADRAIGQVVLYGGGCR